MVVVVVEMAVAEVDRITDQTKGPHAMFKNTLNLLIAVALLFGEHPSERTDPH